MPPSLKEQKQLDKIRTDFIANVSHELRTPVAMLQGYSEALLDDVVGTEEDRREIAASIDDEIEVEQSIEPLDVTAEEEIQGYAILKAILTDILDSDRVYYRDNQSYFNVLLDDNIRKWIVRLYLEASKKYIEFNDEGKERVPIDRVTDILKHSERIKKIAKMFM